MTGSANTVKLEEMSLEHTGAIDEIRLQHQKEIAGMKEAYESRIASLEKRLEDNEKASSNVIAKLERENIKHIESIANRLEVAANAYTNKPLEGGKKGTSKSGDE